MSFNNFNLRKNYALTYEKIHTLTSASYSNMPWQVSLILILTTA